MGYEPWKVVEKRRLCHSEELLLLKSPRARIRDFSLTLRTTVAKELAMTNEIPHPKGSMPGTKYRYLHGHFLIFLYFSLDKSTSYMVIYGLLK